MDRAIVIILLVIIMGTFIYFWPWISKPSNLMANIFGDQKTTAIKNLFQPFTNQNSNALQFYK